MRWLLRSRTRLAGCFDAKRQGGEMRRGRVLRYKIGRVFWYKNGIVLRCEETRCLDSDGSSSPVNRSMANGV